MNLIYISGSPRKKSNTDYLLNIILSITGGEFIKLADYHIEPCKSCRDCRRTGKCLIHDDMQKIIIPKILKCDGMVLGSPVYFNNVSAQMKSFMDRTHSLVGLLKNKVGGAVVVGRRYGAENAITAINAFFLKHEIIPVNRGVFGIAFNQGEIEKDVEAIESAERLGTRIIEIINLLG